MFKFLDKLNEKTEMVNKKDYKYQCTYFWASILGNLLFAFLIFFVVILISSFLFVLLSSNLTAFLPEFTLKYVPFLYESIVTRDPVLYRSDVIHFNGVLLLAFGITAVLSNWDDTLKMIKYFINCACFPLTLVNKGFDFVLSKCCKQLPKE